MADFRMDEIYAIVESAIISGQHQVPVHIFPFKMTWANMTMHQNSKWIHFWENLKEGYDYFEGHRSPPLVTVQDKRYQFFTFRQLLFGGNLPIVAPEFRYAGLKKQRELKKQQEFKRQQALKRQREKQRIAAARKASEKPQYIAKVTPPSTPSAPSLLGLGD